jgi:hypothetical protein
LSSNKNISFVENSVSSRDTLRRWIWIVIFSISFAWVESAVVVYLREIYFDGGFSFPLVVKWEVGEHVIEPLIRIELGREIATIIMLVAAGWLAGKKSFHKFCFFMISFGVWDIFYYIWLYVMKGWPENLMAWDLLFFVPLPWVGPVITPVLIAAAMISAGTLIIYFEEKGYTFHWRWYDMGIELFCALLMITAFCWDWKNILQVPGDIERTGIPNPFVWRLFLPAYIFSVIYFVVALKRNLIKERVFKI